MTRFGMCWMLVCLCLLTACSTTPLGRDKAMGLCLGFSPASDSTGSGASCLEQKDICLAYFEGLDAAAGQEACLAACNERRRLTPKQQFDGCARFSTRGWELCRAYCRSHAPGEASE